MLPKPNIKIGAGLGGLLALTLLAGQGWRDWHSLQAPVRGAAATRAAGGEARAPGAIGELVALDLFGNASAATAPVAARPDPPETQLDLGLRGVFASDSHRLVGAVIATGQGKAGLFRIGEEIAPGVVLHAVAPRSVVIQRAGTLETLHFPLPTTGADAGPRQPAGTASAAANDVKGPRRPSAADGKAAARPRR